MKKENILIEEDENLVTFMKEKTNDNINVYSYIKDIVYNILKEKNLTADKVYISIETVSKEKIRQINKEYRNIDKSTDVLSFPIYDREEIKLLSKQKGNKKIREIELGDIFLCLEVISKQEKEYSTGILRETLYMITHGVCHLVGYDHMIEEEKKEMRTLEEKILNKVGVGKINAE